MSVVFNLEVICIFRLFIDACLEVLFTLPEGARTDDVSRYTDRGQHQEDLLQYLQKETNLDVSNLEPKSNTCGFTVHIYINKLEDYDRANEGLFSELLNSYFETRTPFLVKAFSCNYLNGNDCERHFGRTTVT